MSVMKLHQIVVISPTTTVSIGVHCYINITLCFSKTFILKVYSNVGDQPTTNIGKLTNHDNVVRCAVVSE